MGAQYFVDTQYFQPSAGVLANSNTEASLMAATYPVPANFLYVGRTLKMEAWGKISTTGTPTFRFRVRLGGIAGTVVLDSGAITMGSGISNLIWHITGTLVCRTIGATGTIMGYGEWSGGVGMFSTDRSQMMSSAGASAPAVSTHDTTAALDMTLTGIWSAASASNTCTCDHLDWIAIN